MQVLRNICQIQKLILLEVLTISFGRGTSGFEPVIKTWTETD